jgi:cell division protein FtsZ
MEGAHGVLLSISGGSDLGLFEINEAASLVADAAHADANIIFGAVIDDALGDEVRVTVIAAGFDGGQPKHRPAEPRRAEPAPASPYASASPYAATLHPGRSVPGPLPAARPAPPGNGRRPADLDDDLDIPEFLKG